MTKLIVETDNDWTKRKIKAAIDTEITLLRKVIQRTENKIRAFEKEYGKTDRKSLYGKVDDMELLEWEGEIEILEKLKEKLKSIEEITFEYK